MSQSLLFAIPASGGLWLHMPLCAWTLAPGHDYDDDDEDDDDEDDDDDMTMIMTEPDCPWER